jgi:predicted MFS family arabinose efflux permease
LLSLVYLWLASAAGFYLTLCGVFLLGLSCGLFNVTVASTLQVRSRDDVRGRVMATYSIGILGSALIGAPLAGALADSVGTSDTFLSISSACAGAAAMTCWAWRSEPARG